MSKSVWTKVLVDTGPLVAIFNRGDQFHAICVETLRDIQPPMLTTWPILTEVAWLLRNHSKGLERLFAGVKTGIFRIVTLAETDLAELAAIQNRFQSLRPQLADLTLILVAERERLSTIFTLDRRDFTVIQKKSRPKLVLLPEELG